MLPPDRVLLHASHVTLSIALACLLRVMMLFAEPYHLPMPDHPMPPHISFGWLLRVPADKALSSLSILHGNANVVAGRNVVGLRVPITQVNDKTLSGDLWWEFPVIGDNRVEADKEYRFVVWLCLPGGGYAEVFEVKR